MNPDAFELLDRKPRVEVQEEEYIRLLGYPRGRELQGRARELADQARQWYAEHGRPWIFARSVDEVAIGPDSVRIDPVEFGSRKLVDLLTAAQAHSLVVVAVSAGSDCEERAHELWREDKPDEYFFMESFGSAVVEQLIAIASGRICGWADSRQMAALPHYSPGYSGWDVSEQAALRKLMQPAGGNALPGDLHVLDSGMLRPKKSLLAAVGITRHLETVARFAKLVPCENCSLAGCQYRRAPYAFSLPQVEDVRRLQRRMMEDDQAPAVPAGLTRGARYSLNPRALRKWSQERLELKPKGSGELEATFRYEGTTCSNLGRSLEFIYRVVVSPASDAYRIIEASCAPAPGDTGHTFQCEYLNDAIGLMGSIANEKPLLGRPLDDVLKWNRPSDPSGCFCDNARRDHKWGLVYEVIHYALVQRETLSGNGHAARSAQTLYD